jgi:hypothetical protein
MKTLASLPHMLAKTVAALAIAAFWVISSAGTHLVGRLSP